MRSKLVLLSLCVSFIGAAYYFWPKTERAPTQQAMTAIPVLVVTPVTQDIPLHIEAVGVLQASVYLELRPQVSGTISEILVDEGQWIEAHTPLIKIDHTPYLIRVKEAEAQLAMDRIGLDGARKKLNRYRALAQKDLVAQIEWDELEAQVDRAEATLLADEAKLQSAALELQRCTVSTPAAGRVGRLDVSVGQLVSNGQTTPLAVVSTIDPLLVEFQITEKDLPKIAKQNCAVSVQAICDPNLEAAGCVTFFDSQFNPTTGLLMVRGSVSNKDTKLRPGQSVRIRIPVGTAANAMLVPQKAVKYSQEGPYLLIVQADETVGQRQVQLGAIHGDAVVVLEGIASTDLVITDGHLRALPGLKVEVK